MSNVCEKQTKKKGEKSWKIVLKNFFGWLFYIFL